MYHAQDRSHPNDAKGLFGNPANSFANLKS